MISRPESYIKSDIVFSGSFTVGGEERSRILISFSVIMIN